MRSDVVVLLQLGRTVGGGARRPRASMVDGPQQDQIGAGCRVALAGPRSTEVLVAGERELVHEGVAGPLSSIEIVLVRERREQRPQVARPRCGARAARTRRALAAGRRRGRPGRSRPARGTPRSRRTRWSASRRRRGRRPAPPSPTAACRRRCAPTPQRTEVPRTPAYTGGGTSGWVGEGRPRRGSQCPVVTRDRLARAADAARRRSSDSSASSADRGAAPIWAIHRSAPRDRCRR
jgi:hypothetical protein